MILVDTSVWVPSQRASNRQLVDELAEGTILAHPFVIGKLALGNWNQRSALLETMAKLPQAPVAGEAEVLALIERHSLYGRGVGYVDVHLLSSALLGDRTQLWTLKPRLQILAHELGVLYAPRQGHS